MSGKRTREALGDGGISDGAKLDNANAGGQQNSKDTMRIASFTMPSVSNEIYTNVRN